MGTNSALMADKVIENAFQVLSIELISIVQAIDIMNCQDKIGSESKTIFNDISKLAKGIDADEPGFEKIIRVNDYLMNNLTQYN